ncbi:hypothetical protein AB6A40_002076 [Gnathostoma spinigerum]|uniref:Uncharacterized protein n=1 Tax=Gnathostoma spinigerum TaxID=75299 RepID=A0ABD6EFP9_9BILA
MRSCCYGIARLVSYGRIQQVFWSSLPVNAPLFSILTRVSSSVSLSSQFSSSASNNLTSRIPLNTANSSKIALIFDEERAITYGQLARYVGQYVSLLHLKYALKRGERVLGRVEKNLDSLALYLATLRLGGIYVPINPSFTDHETEHFVQDCKPSLLVSCKKKSDDRFHEYVTHVVDAIALAREAAAAKPTYDVEHVAPHDLACICYTSGTTGVPKGAMISHEGLVWNADSLIKAWRFTSDDVLLHLLPFNHVHGLFISLNCSLFTGSSVVFRPKFAVNDAMKWLPKATVMMGVPTYYSRLMERNDFGRSVTAGIRLFVSGSAPLSSALWKNFQKRTGSAILERYGMTEAAVITSNLYEEEGRIPGSVGKVLEGGELRLSSSGVIEVLLPSLFRGYWRNPEETARNFTNDGFFITGDIGSIDHEGYLYLLGRQKDMIISGGLNVYPKEIEDAIDWTQMVNETAVIGLPHMDLGEAVVAVCAMNTHAQDEKLEATVKERLKLVLTNYKIPKKIIFVDSLPRNSMGKVQKKLLRECYHKLFLESK